MNVTYAALREIDVHWAVLAVGEAERDRGLSVADAWLVKKAVGQQMQIAFSESTRDEDLLTRADNGSAFDVLVSTPAKLQLVIRNKKVSRPLALVVMDEAHNIEDETRGLRIELLLATIKRECASANFLLLMPYVQGPTRWPAGWHTISTQDGLLALGPPHGSLMSASSGCIGLRQTIL